MPGQTGVKPANFGGILYKRLIGDGQQPGHRHHHPAVQLGDDEVLKLYDRSSNPVKRGIALINSVGIIDSDYYPQEFKGLFMNISKEPVTISKGQRIMQGVFVKYLTTDDDNANGKRTGGFGSTGEV